MKALVDLLYNPPAIIWPLVALVVMLIVLHSAREALNPIIKAVVSSVALNAQKHGGSYATGFVFAFAASTTALEKVAENMHWPYVAAAAQVLNPGLVAIIAYMRPSPTQPPSGLSASPFTSPTTPQT